MHLNQTKPSTPAEAFALAAARDAPLQKRLDIYSAFSRELRPEINQAYDELIARLSGLKKIGPPIGAPFPGFHLPDQDGNLVSLDSLLSEGPLILSLNRGHWCPWCRLELRALAQIDDEARKLGAQVVSIIPETLAYSRRLIADNGLCFRVLTDLDLAYALSLGLMIWAGDRIRALYTKSGLDLPLFQKNEGWFLPIPATFLLGPDGVVRARFADPDFRKRMDPEDILSALHKLSRS
jgi:peroxiredoxin